MTEILEGYQNSLFVFANAENALGVLLKECGKHDRTKAGKIMSIAGKSLTQSSHQVIKLYMPLMRLYQEMETFHSRAVEDTAETVDNLETKRSAYRASLMWMKDISEKLDPDIYRQLDKFRRVQAKVRNEKRVFDSIQMDVVQKIDLLMASRCNLINQVIAPYQSVLLETFEKDRNNFKSVEELIKKEDIYEYEFKALKQLNPLRLDQCDRLDTEGPIASAEAPTEASTAAAAPIQTVNLLMMDEEPTSLDDRGAESDDANNNDAKIGDDFFGKKMSNLKLISQELSGPSSPVQRVNNSLIDIALEDDPGPSRQVTSLENLIEEPKDTLDLIDSLFGSKTSESSSKIEGEEKKQPTIDDLMTNELDDIDNSSYFKSLQGLQI